MFMNIKNKKENVSIIKDADGKSLDGIVMIPDLHYRFTMRRVNWSGIMFLL